MAESGEFLNRVFALSPGLVLRFKSYGALVTERWPSRLDVRLPFFHLSTQMFWEALDPEMRKATSPEYCAVCEMPTDLFDLLSNSGFRVKARIILIKKYFSAAEQVSLFESLGIRVGPEKNESTSRLMEETEDSAKRKGRSARFAVRVCSEYRYTCALTGYRCVTSDGATIVDAAHIEAWAATQNDDPSNGLALSKNAHWMFDEGLWSVDGDFRVVVNLRAFTEQGPEPLRLSSFSGRHLQFDPAAKLRPSPEFLRTHRLRWGFRV